MGYRTLLNRSARADWTNDPAREIGALFVVTVRSRVFRALISSLPAPKLGVMSQRKRLSNSIESRILVVRGISVMMESDLADLYRVKTKALLQESKSRPIGFTVDFENAKK
jgi:hypothetical protein